MLHTCNQLLDVWRESLILTNHVVARRLLMSIMSYHCGDFHGCYYPLRKYSLTKEVQLRRVTASKLKKAMQRHLSIRGRTKPQPDILCLKIDVRFQSHLQHVDE